MAKIDFSQLNLYNKSGQANRDLKYPRIDYFGLKNDGDEAVIRFAYSDDVSEFDILTIHPVSIGEKKHRKVNCLRNPLDPIDSCPFCEEKREIQQKFYAKMIQYEPDGNGGIKVVPKIWERQISFATKLSEYMKNYGDLSNMVCKIIRHGAAGNLKTEYEIIPNLSPVIYSEAMYPKDFSGFDNFSVLGPFVMNKTYDDLCYFNANGTFPAKIANQSAEVPAANTVAQQIPTSNTVTEVPQAPVAPVAPATPATPATPTAQTSEPMPWEVSTPAAPAASQQSASAPNRPRRY